MKRLLKILSIALLFQFYVIDIAAKAAREKKSVSIVVDSEAGYLEKFAAKEVRRYLYLRTGKLIKIIQGDWNQLSASSDLILIGSSHSKTIIDFSDFVKLSDSLKSLKDEAFMLKSFTFKSPQARSVLLRTGSQSNISKFNFLENRKILLVCGKDGISTLHAAYKLMEHFGIRYTLNCDVIPDGIVPMEIPVIDRIYQSQFAIRGMLPYHSWNPEGPENWNEDAYKSFLSQQVKMGLNFMGLIYDFTESDRRTYIFPPEKQQWSPGDYWIDTPPFGAEQVFKSSLYGSDRWLEARKLTTPEERSAYMKQANMKFMGEVFSFAHLFDIKCAIGAENRGNQAYFETLFKELGSIVKPDFFWISSPETWSYSSPPQKTTDELVSTYQAAFAARNAISAPFEMATMGWALGPQNDPLVLDRNLPKEIIMSTQNLNVGKGPVQPEWAQIAGRRKWAIPWMEDDFNLLSPQLWVNRTIQNAADAKKYGCEGLIGVQWRTKTLTPQTVALAELGWNNQVNTKSFYDDFAKTQFGIEAADQLSTIFQHIDSKLPEASQWLDMWPGGIKKDSTYWLLNKDKYDFVAQFERLRPAIVGKGNIERFDYYLNQYKYLRGLAKFKSAFDKLEEETYLREAMNALIQSASSMGEIGNMVCITRQFGKNRPLDYTGKPQLIVLTPRTSLLSGENLHLDVFFVESGSPQKVELFWRPLGEIAFKKLSATRHKQNYFVVKLLASEIGGRDIEYFIKGITAAGNEYFFPATAPERGLTVVSLNASSAEHMEGFFKSD